MAVFLFVFMNLTLINVMPKTPLLLLERLFHGGGWVQVGAISLYAGIVAWHMQDPASSAEWRKKTWFLFSVVFFVQLILGVTLGPVFLMTGKLHLPIPAMILAGPTLPRRDLGDDSPFCQHSDPVGAGMVQSHLLFRRHRQLFFSRKKTGETLEEQKKDQVQHLIYRDRRRPGVQMVQCPRVAGTVGRPAFRHRRIGHHDLPVAPAEARWSSASHGAPSGPSSTTTVLSHPSGCISTTPARPACFVRNTAAMMPWESRTSSGTSRD